MTIMILSLWVMKMKLNLQSLLKKGIFKEYNILSGEDNLNINIESMSILETPDFKNYIIENSLILTTFYPIKADMKVASNLIDSLKKFNTAGLIIKPHRYIDNIPQEFIDHAKELNYPIITINYDANLSILFSNITAEIQRSDYETYSLEYTYSNLLSKVYENPSTKTLLDTVNSIENFELLIHNLEDNTIHNSSESILEKYKKYGSTQSLIQRNSDSLYYSEAVIYEGKPIYQMVFLTTSEKRHILHNYTEIFKLMIIIIYQKKLENSLKQNRFLVQFLSDKSSHYTKSQIIAVTKTYNWNITFPITLGLFNISQDDKIVRVSSLKEYINTVIVNKFHILESELRYTYMDDNLALIINTMESTDINSVFNIVYNILQNKFPQYKIRLAYSELIFDNSIISEKYNLLSSGMENIIRKKLSLKIFTEDYIELINLMKGIEHLEVIQYITKTIKPLIDYEEQHNIPLINTLYEYISSKFNIKETSEKMYTHYNTIRYRIDLVSKLGIDISSSHDFFSIYLALYFYKNLQYK